MKYLMLRCEDEARSTERMVSLLEGAKTPYLQHLAQAGAAGLIDSPVLGRLQLHRALFGLGPSDPEAAPGVCYAASAMIKIAEGETAWCCELVTHQEGRIVDATAGDIPTKESRVLIQALNDHLGSETRRWEVGHGSHHVLVVRDPRLGEESGSIPSPDLLVGQAWTRGLPKGRAGKALQLLIEQASKLLEEHPVNRVRVDLGENPANLAWYWGPALGGRLRTFTDRTGLSGALASPRFPLRGFAQALGLGWMDAPASFDEPILRSLAESVERLIDRHDVVYVHLPIQSADPVQRLCAMERVDQVLLQPLAERLPSYGPWRLLTVVDDRPNHRIPFVAIGDDLPKSPIARLTVESFAESSIVFQEGSSLFSWFTAGAKP